MKRSEINAIMRQANEFLQDQNFHLPPFAYWTPEEWQEQRNAHTDTLQNVTRPAYDPIGRLITTTDAAGLLTVNTYDNADHLVAVTRNYTTTSAEPNYLDAYNLITRYQYDGFGRQIAVTDTVGHVTRNFYDGAGRLVSTTVNYWPAVGPNYQSLYNFWYSSILPDLRQDELDDRLTVLNKALQLLQQRASRIEDSTLRWHYLNNNRWNAGLFAEARQRKLI